MAISTFNLVFEWEKKIAPGISHLAFRKLSQEGQEIGDERFEFEPGQFITLLFGEGKDLKRRSYSIASLPPGVLPKVELIEVVVSYVKGGLASEILFNLKPGQVLKAMGPVGRLILKKEEPKARYILIGTGTGIGPYRSMLPALLDRVKQNSNFSVDIILGVRTQQEAMFKADFEAFADLHPNIRFQVCYSREKPENLNKSLNKNARNNEHLGYVQESFARLNLKPEQDAVYLCGNPNMIDEAFESLKNLGFEIGDIRREKYISS
jgi:ferredoxin-NADP reductase